MKQENTEVKTKKEVEVEIDVEKEYKKIKNKRAGIRERIQDEIEDNVEREPLCRKGEKTNFCMKNYMGVAINYYLIAFIRYNNGGFLR